MVGALSMRVLVIKDEREVAALVVFQLNRAGNFHWPGMRAYFVLDHMPCDPHLRCPERKPVESSHSLPAR